MDYVVQRRTGTKGWTTVTDGRSRTTSATVGALTNGVPYSFRVAARTSSRTGAFTRAAAAVPRTTPGAPRSLTAVAGDGRAQLTWQAPASDGGSVVTDYVVEVAVDDAWRVVEDGAGARTTAEVAGLANGTEHRIRVRAVNVAGRGTASSQVAVTPLEPGAPRVGDIAVAAGDRQALVTWTTEPGAPDALDAAVQTSSSANGPWSAPEVFPASRGEHLVTDLQNDVETYLRVRTVLDGDGSAWSPPLAVVPHGPTTCGQLEGDEVWTAGPHVLECPVSTGPHVLHLRPGASVSSRGLSVDDGGRLRATGLPEAPVRITKGCEDPGCETVLVHGEGTLVLRRTVLDEQVVTTSDGGDIDVSMSVLTGSRVDLQGGSPQLVGNSFTGAATPVVVRLAADLSGIRGNTATGTPAERTFEYASNSAVQGHWTPEGTGSGIIHRLSGVMVNDGGHAQFGPGTTSRLNYFYVHPGGLVTTTGTATAPATFTALCSHAGDLEPDPTCIPDPDHTSQDASLPEHQLGVLDLPKGATSRIDHAEFHDTRFLLGLGDPVPGSATTALGHVRDSTLTRTSVLARPASLTWQDNTFTTSTLEIDGGDDFHYVDNTHRATQVVIRSVGRPVLDENEWTATDDPLTVNDATDLSGIAGTNTAHGDSDRQRRLTFFSSTVAGGETMTLVDDGTLNSFRNSEVEGTLDAPPGAVLEMATDIEVDGGATLTADDALITGSDGSGGNRILVEPNGTLSLAGGQLNGSIRGVCGAAKAGGAIISVRRTVFSGAARFEVCNLHWTGCPAASAIATSGVSYWSSHLDLCVWALPQPTPPPPPYSRREWHVHGPPDDAPCLPDYKQLDDSSPVY